MTLTLHSADRLALTRLVVVLLSVSLSASVAIASPEEDLEKLSSYFEFSTGATFVPHQTLRNGATAMSRAEQDPGFHIGGAVGTRVMDLVRAEVAVSYRESPVDKMGVAGPPTEVDGEISLLSVMANAYYDLRLGIGVIPYIGAGVGWGQFQLDARTKVAGQLDIDDRDDVFVYNAMLGATLPFSKVASISLGYRYVGTEGGDEIGAIIGGINQHIQAEFDAHEVDIGLKFHF